jgi:hypothetical protein
MSPRVIAWKGGMRISLRQGYSILGSDTGSPLGSGPSNGFDHLSDTQSRSRAGRLRGMKAYLDTAENSPSWRSQSAADTRANERRYNLLLRVEALLSLVFERLRERVAAFER